MSDWIVVLTGGIGSGKSAVASRFSQHGVEIVEQDQISREIVEPGTDSLDVIVQRFGTGILLVDGTLNRPKLRSIVFENLTDRRWLEQLTHPLIGEYTRRYIEEARSEYVIVVNPLLRERPRGYHRVLVVDVSQEIQIIRTMGRDSISEELARSMIQAQLDRKSRLAIADDVLVNDGDLEALSEQVDRLHETYLNLARSSQARSDARVKSTR